MHHLDFLDICAILLGISFTIAKLDAQGRKAENFGHIPAVDFERWREWTTSIYRLGSTACFARVVFHQAWVLYVSRQPMTGPVFSDAGGKLQALPRTFIIPALIVDALAVGAIAVTFVRANRARALRRQLGIVLSPMTPRQAAATEDDDRSKPE